MKVLQISLWIVGICIVIAGLIWQSTLFEHLGRTTGYPAKSAREDAYTIYAQFDDNPKFAPAVEWVRELVADKGQLDFLGIREISVGKSGRPTTVTMIAKRKGITYLEVVTFDDDGTVMSISPQEEVDAD